MFQRSYFRPVSLVAIFLVVIPAMLMADGGVTFTDIAAGDNAGIDYRRGPSPSDEILNAFLAREEMLFTELGEQPLKSRGAPGLAILDFDGDGDDDLYVANGPGVANSLYSNQYLETGEVTFIDVGIDMGVDATSQDSTGVCFGDTDNDGDPDLLVLGKEESHRFFINEGGLMFSDGTLASGIGNNSAASMSCTMGDINGDGYLDIYVGNVKQTLDDWQAFFVPFALNAANALFLNQGDNQFTDVSQSSGVLDLAVTGNESSDFGTLTWAVALVDIDLDGDVDLLQADDQLGLPAVERGFLQLLLNDGTGQFTTVTRQVGLARRGAWMGLSFADFDHNGTMDFFGSNGGNHGTAAFFGPQAARGADSRWFLQQEDGTFFDINSNGEQLQTPFGWGTSAEDYDNDGDTDIIFHGGLMNLPVIFMAPGSILQNDGEANFRRDFDALAGSTDHNLRTVNGMAAGDFNHDGFIDIASVSNFDLGPEVPITPAPDIGGEFQQDAFFVRMGVPIDNDPLTFGFLDIDLPDNGTVSVELSSGDNGNNWVQIDLVGTFGLTTGGKSNRDGIGAVISFTPQNGKTAMKPVLGGASYASQDSLSSLFGLGDANQGMIEVLWPGGTRNRLYNVQAGSRTLMPEIPCSIDNSTLTFQAYLGCVDRALGELLAQGLIEGSQLGQFRSSAIRGFQAVAREPNQAPTR